MELILDLGIKSRKGGYRERFGIFECPVCRKHFETSIKSVKSKKSTKCKSCSISIISSKHLMSDHKLYKKFFDMKTRCYNKNSKAYKYYGHKGIVICEEWLQNPYSFVEWGIKNGYKEGLEIDRKNPFGNYEPLNCRFVSKLINAQNKKNINKSKGAVFRKNTNRWYCSITHNKKNFFIGNFDKKEDALIAYDLFILDNKTNHALNEAIPANFDRNKWESKIKNELLLRQRKTKVTSLHIDYIKKSNLSAYKLAMELPYCKATIQKIKNNISCV
jgi:hypothetical protein